MKENESSEGVNFYVNDYRSCNNDTQETLVASVNISESSHSVSLDLYYMNTEWMMCIATILPQTAITSLRINSNVLDRGIIDIIEALDKTQISELYLDSDEIDLGIIHRLAKKLPSTQITHLGLSKIQDAATYRDEQEAD